MKQKTKQAAAKRFSKTGTGKIKRRAVGQAHFNSRESGKQKRGKRGVRISHSTDRQRIQELLPYLGL